jgi:two-component system LytT family response regulator
MIKTILVDDELHCREALEILISTYCPELKLIASCSDGLSGVVAIQKHRPDLVFLDIAMPGMDGFEMLEKVGDIDFEVVFTTAYDEYAIKAFKVNAVDYLLKPIHRKELIQSVERISELITLKEQKKDEDQSLLRLLTNLKNSNKHEQISIPTLEGLEMQNINDILYIKSDGNYSELHTENEKPKLISKTLKYFELKLEAYSNFCRIHNSALINKNKMIKYVKGKGGYVVMKNGEMINVSRQKKRSLLKEFGF